MCRVKIEKCKLQILFHGLDISEMNSTGDEDNLKSAKITMSTFGNLEPFEGGEVPTYKERLEAFLWRTILV